MDLLRKALTILVTALMLAACSRYTDSVPQAPQASSDAAFVKGTVILQVSEDLAEAFLSGNPQTKSAQTALAFDRIGVSGIERVYPDAGEWEARHREAGLHRWFRITYDNKDLPATKAADEFSDIPGILYCEPERRIKTASYFNDPYAPQQWDLYNDGTLGRSYSAGCDINVVPVWENYTTGSPDVIVAVIDQGVQLDHPDLAAICIPGGNNGSRSFVYGYEGYTIYPGDHGTHVAGTIAAINNNETGVCGIAGGSDASGGVRIMSCSIFREDPSDPEKTIQGNSENAMVWAADHGAVVCNNSWGYVYDSETDAMNGNVGSMKPAIDYFIKYAGCDKNGEQRPDSPMKGGLVVFAAGNEGYKMGWPAAYKEVVAVGATSASFSRAYYSNYGDWVDICAPGGDVKLGPTIVSTATKGGYALMQGTSMACPHVSGIAALLVSYFGGPGFTCEMLKERLLGGAVDGRGPNMIGPMADALGSFTYGGTIPPEAASIDDISVKSNFVTLSWKVTPDEDDNKAFGYILLASKDREILEAVNPKEKISDQISYKTVESGTAAVGETISGTLDGLEFEADYFTAIISYDYNHNYSELSEIKTVRTGINHAPVITADFSGDLTLKSHENRKIAFTIEDPDGHSFKTELTPGSDAIESHSGSNSDVITREIHCLKADPGKYTCTLTATDKFGLASVFSFNYEIMPNHAPKAKVDSYNQLLTTIGEACSLNVSDFFIDEDGETLNYDISYSGQNVAHINPAGDEINITALGYGLTSAEVTAKDARGESCTMTVKVFVRDSSRPVELYPNPVSKTLYVRPGEDASLKVSMSNKVGATVYSSSAEISPFDPLAIDVTGMPAGTYYVRVVGSGIDDVFVIAKI